MPTAITLSGLTKEYRDAGQGGATVVAVHAVDLRIEAGELFFLLGPSGCGKTTLLRMIAGFIEPTKGRILFGTTDITNLTPNKRNAGMVFQSYALWPHMTIEENVCFGLSVRKISIQDQRRRALEALERVHMASYAKRKPTQLSGGQQQRVALARAIVIQPDVLLLDEPLSNLDARLRLDLRSEIRRICKESGTTTVYVTHDQREALSMADRIAIVESGRLTQTGTPTELYRRPKSRFVAEFLGETNFIDGVVSEVRGHRAQVRTAIGSLWTDRGTGLEVGRQMLCSVRPECWQLHDSVQAGLLPGKLRHRTYLGDVTQYEVAVDGRSVTVNVQNASESLEIGREVHLGLAESDLAVIPI